jgi:4-hydroxy-tetrahydrodipicolinate reductase
LISGDKTVRFEFTHNVNGRDVYARGTLDAVLYLNGKVAEGAAGNVYTMIDVLKMTRGTLPAQTGFQACFRD